MHYVRSRKLTSSLEELKNSDLSVIDIAMEYKFEYEQSYIRSFKKQFRVSPGIFRKEKPTLEIKHKLNLAYITLTGEQGML